MAQAQPYTHVDTGYLRRKPVEWTLKRLIDRIQADGRGVVSVAYYDIDGFTIIEQQHGYELADKLLEGVARTLDDIGEADLAAWYVRDSFLLIYDGATIDDVFFKTETIRRQLSETTFHVQGTERSADLAPTFSAGVATYPGDPEDHTELIDLAEDAARRAHESGGNRSTFGRAENMIPKTSHFLPTQLERLRTLKDHTSRSEASLLREALSDLLRKYDQRDSRRHLVSDSPAGTSEG